jgi:hypothetical protein
MHTTSPSERDQFVRIYEGLSDDAKRLLVDVLGIESENLHYKQPPPGIVDQIVKKVEGIVK